MKTSTISKSLFFVFALLIYSFSLANAQDTLVFHMDFEEGSGIPMDKSSYGQSVSVEGDINYDSDAPYGSHSFFFDASAKTQIRVDGSELATTTFTLDFFFKTDTLNGGLWLINKWGESNGTDFYHRPNYGVIMHNGDGVIGGVTWDLGSGGPTGLNQRSGDESGEEMVQKGKWYNVIFVASQDTQFFQLRNVNGDILGDGGYSPQGDVATNPNQPLMIGDAHLEDDPPRNFEGFMDDIRIYNYARIESDGSYNPPNRTGTNIDDPSVNIPNELTLKQNYPNPFNPSTRITYGLPAASHVSLKVYNAAGQHVATLVDQSQSAGEHTAVWNGSEATSGVYYYTIDANGVTKTRSMTLIK